ncbi:MAG: hypothetical protein AAB336_10010 [Acidobacteriota bacterium]
MRNLTTFLLFGVIFVSTISAQNSVVPIVYGETLLGGAHNGKWVTAEQTERQFKDKTEFKLIGFTEIELGVFVGTKAERGVCENARITFAKLDGEAEDNDEQNLMLGTFADWDPLPRIPKKIALSNKANHKIVADFLKTNGISITKINITQAFRIDLESDGKDEIIITGIYLKKAKKGEEIAADGQQSAGDYSFILLRKTVKGKPQNILIEGDFYTSKLLRSGEYPMPSVREIAAIADLNGDGKMEFVLREIYYEGNRTAVFEIKNGKLVKVLESECSV